MSSSSLLTFVITALLLVLDPTIASGLYSKNSPVIQIDAKNYETIIAKSNYTSVRWFVTVHSLALLTPCPLDPRVLCSLVRPLPESKARVRKGR